MISHKLKYLNRSYSGELQSFTNQSSANYNDGQIWRCYLVWGRGRLGIAVSVVPALVALDADVYCIWALVTKIKLFHTRGANDPSIVNTLDPSIGVFALLALASNLMFTVLI
ncbi:hypothetical protein PQX77_005009, partial [Marasmius sp. AFHP31]